MKSEKETIYDYATELKLLAFKEELEYTLSLAAGENWSHLHFLTELLGKESVRRRECRRKSRIKSAGFPQMKYLYELVMEDMPKEAQVILPELETLDFIREGRNIVLYGNPGTGKTHIATALGIKCSVSIDTLHFDYIRSVFIDGISYGICAMRYGTGFCYHNSWGILFSKVIFYLDPAVDKLSSGPHPLFHKSGIAEINCTFIRLDGFHG